MLHVSIHAGPLKEVCAGNRLDWLDIGYGVLGTRADYKVALYQVDKGAAPVVLIKDYPRWSASIWDLIIRAIAMGLSAAMQSPQERFSPHVPRGPGKRFADAESLCAIVQHSSPNGLADRRVGSLQIVRSDRIRGLYRATLAEDRRPDLAAPPFIFKPERLLPCELIARAALMAMTGSLDVVPERPVLMKPLSREVNGTKYVLVGRLPEPVRTGFERFLRKIKRSPIRLPDNTEEGAPHDLYDRFMREVA
jgi:hypothetical protein